MKYKLIIFDFDGTLADTLPWFLSIIDKVVEKFKLKNAQLSDFEMLRNLDTKKALKKYDISFWKAAVIGRYVMGLMEKDIEKISLFNGMDQIIKKLSRADLHLALVSSNSYHNVQQVLGQELAGIFKYYECGVSLLGKKSKFNKIIKKSNVAKKDTLCIGDEIRDIQAANQANIPFGAVSWGYSNINALKAYAPEEVFSTVDDIFEKLLITPSSF